MAAVPGGREGGTGRAAPDEAAGLEALLTSRPLEAVEWGLGRTRTMLADLGDPQRAFRSVHVGGTNGKGSTAAMVSSVLRAAGFRAGLYTSPELRETRDRYRVDGEPLSTELLDACAARVAPLARATGATFFEAATVLAFLAFREAGVEWAAVEVGLGGRLDATNVLRPEACAVTGVAMDHARYLGNELEEVAAEKAGILKRDVPCALGPLPDRLLDVFRRRAGETGARLRLLGREARVEEVEVDLEGTSFSYVSEVRPEGLRLRVPLPGAHQARNAGVALLALESLAEPPPADAVREGLAAVRWRGRFELLRRPDGDWILDAGHNPSSAAALVETLAAVDPTPPVVLVLSVLRDKPWREILATLEGPVEAVVLTVAPSSPEARAWRPETAAAAARRPAEVVSDFAAALGRARELAGEGTVLVTGSCYAAGDALGRLEGDGA